ncbi:hypothetical protein Glove_123g95 [Diversispora epigaea]|uniref:Uncharacterized protein n=1 Tax=Diversispora epigaea TaxID=1348612 RepID=A0A397IZ27_9GLOM|nr:hypothetical protein Glove_123g95 [Diversispora epigaea]
MSEVKEKEFELFFTDKANVNMSSYKGRLGGLCLTCNDYGYQPFRDLIELVITNFSNQTQKNNPIHELENLQHYLRRKYEKKFVINKNETINHTDYKANVNMSSYKVNSKTQLPILYIKDQKNAFWNKFSGRLGGLCLTCNDYGYQPFRDLIELVITNFSNQTQKNNPIHELENLQHYLRRKYEKKFVINKNETINHTDYLKIKFDIKHYLKLNEYQEKLICYLAYQTRKSYLNTQFNSILYELDNYDAIIIVDYRMRILPAIARETKSEFFRKRGWTLHITLVFRKDKNNNEKLDIQAYDHWSLDTKQDAWFTASYFECVFLSINLKPNWIKIISDNGDHYHNSELMTIIKVCGWIFFKPGEAKTTVDFHHAVIAHAIKRYIRVDHSLTNGEDIEKALHNLSISKWFEWTWPITGEFAGYVHARSLPYIGNWINFSPAQISNFCGTIHRSSPIASESTKINSS